jgi:hypothetical protein
VGVLPAYSPSGAAPGPLLRAGSLAG